LSVLKKHDDVIVCWIVKSNLGIPNSISRFLVEYLRLERLKKERYESLI